jgi:hypothetical protein
VIKEWYCYTRTYGAPQSKKKTIVTSPSSEPNLETEKAKEALPVLSLAALDEQAFIFKLAMKGNCHVAMEGDLPLDPLTRLWRQLEGLGWCMDPIHAPTSTTEDPLSKSPSPKTLLKTPSPQSWRQWTWGALSRSPTCIWGVLGCWFLAS